tara:strand:- start:25 stop:213 length:189 start_codon:yes stop_codon:yes gene_type:complete
MRQESIKRRSIEEQTMTPVIFLVTILVFQSIVAFFFIGYFLLKFNQIKKGGIYYSIHSLPAD